jgi:hypothetical protein
MLGRPLASLAPPILLPDYFLALRAVTPASRYSNHSREPCRRGRLVVPGLTERHPAGPGPRNHPREAPENAGVAPDRDIEPTQSHCDSVKIRGSIHTIRDEMISHNPDCPSDGTKPPRKEGARQKWTWPGHDTNGRTMPLPATGSRGSPPDDRTVSDTSPIPSSGSVTR